jgi:methyl-accepting chemotaxis protein
VNTSELAELVLGGVRSVLDAHAKRTDLRLREIREVMDQQDERLNQLSKQLELLTAKVAVSVDFVDGAREDAREAKKLALDTKLTTQACTDQVLELTQAVRSRPCLVPAIGEPCMSVAMAANRRGLRVVAEPMTLVDESEGL